MDNYRATELYRERLAIFEEKWEDYGFIMRSYAAATLQKMFRTRRCSKKRAKSLWLVKRKDLKKNKQLHSMVSELREEIKSCIVGAVSFLLV